MVSDIQGKWALVTGASRGVGQQIALGLAQLGANVVIHSSHLSNQDQTKELIQAYDVQLKQVACNLEHTEDIQQCITQAEEISGGIDIVYNNAAIMTPEVDLFDTPAEHYHQSFQVNVYAVIQISNFFASRMKARGWGRIINTTSGIKDQPNLDAYSITKAALDKYTKDLAVELNQSGVLANLLDPGWCRTSLGGPHAWNDVTSVLPGALLPAIIAKTGEEEPKGMLFCAQDYAGMTLF